MEPQSGQQLIDLAYQALLVENYDQAIDLYQQAISTDPTVKSAYWQLGLALLLQGEEAEAQMTWLMGMEGDLDQVEQWSHELVEVLQHEAERQAELENFAIAWALRHHCREFFPEDISNLLQILVLSIQLKTFTPEDLVELGILDGLREPQTVVKETLGLHLLEQFLDEMPPHPLLIEFADVIRPHVSTEAYINMVRKLYRRIGYQNREFKAAEYLAKFCLDLQPQDVNILIDLAVFHLNLQQYQEGIETARRCLAATDSLPDRAYVSYLLLLEIMSAGGYWEEAVSTLTEHEQVLQQLLATSPLQLDALQTSRLNSLGLFHPYLRDTPQENRRTRTQLFDIFQSNTQAHHQNHWEKYQARHQDWRSQPDHSQKLKVGYVSHSFRQHSVGWLCRWLLRHHDHDQVEVYLYMVHYTELPQDVLRPHFLQLADHTRTFGGNHVDAAEAIFADNLDILVDLDSITMGTTVSILSLKPAPIQVTWLGWDAIGLSTVDYFIADPYVLPEDAQEYYTEKIWRLPQTYIAVDGFEVGVPNLRREELDIPAGSIIYLSSQSGYKRHRDTAKLQLEIIRQVPNSYFLIKGLADAEAIRQFFYQLADEVGVEHSRLRFAPQVWLEEVHRANLAIADVVLDTFPYNGATTTLETLWMGIPLVTRVGEQFAARNSYTMLKNAGVAEGIAWTNAEYIEWGVRFGTDESLRQQVHSKLFHSRQTAPLWNGKQFARDMEAAYREMVKRERGNGK